MGKLFRSGLLGLGFAAVPAVASACLVCVDLPDVSLADHVADAQAVALLRPSPDDPSRYVAITYLKGGPDLPPVPFAVSAADAEALRQDPEAVTIGVFTFGSWNLRDQGSAALGETVRAALAADLSTPEAMLAFFGPLAVHPDPAVRRMALTELGALPYPVLRQSRSTPSRQAVAGLAFDPGWSQWAPVVIMLLGASDDPEDARFVRAAIDRLASAGHTTDLAAWSTALIEVDGVAALDRLKARFADGTNGSVKTVRALAIAYADHAMRRDSDGDAALAALVELAVTWPEAAGYLARALMDREDWSEGRRLSQMLAEGRIADPADEFFIGHYVASAEAAGP